MQKGERIQVFFERLKTCQKNFTSHTETYSFIKGVFETIENEFVEEGKGKMNILPLSQWGECSVSDIFFLKTPKHIIFLNKNGTLGLYEFKLSPNFWTFYRAGSTKILELSGSASLWP